MLKKERRLAGLITTSKLQLEILDPNRYLLGQLSIFGYGNYKHSDTIVSNVMSYSDWVSNHKLYTGIKVEGLETSDLSKHFKNIKIKNIHLFLNQKTGFSFRWHRDDVNVFLYVVKGYKRVYIKNKVLNLKAGEGVYIPKRTLHKVFSNKDTWALSVGY